MNSRARGWFGTQHHVYPSKDLEASSTPNTALEVPNTPMQPWEPLQAFPEKPHTLRLKVTGPLITTGKKKRKSK